ncbi:MAG: M48 family metalloprotease [Deltaproteobacteria bacterium]|nr:M48 family metalloprotease [Deltaproteobacteria bacterium]
MSFLLYFSERWHRGAALLILTFFCAAMGVTTPKTAWALSLSEEKELGEKILQQIREKLPLIEDGEILTYVQSVGNRVSKQVGTTSYQHNFFVVDQPVPNAFAVPGGNIFIYRGLIEMMSSEGELASILAHELAHIQARHIHRRLEESKILNVATIAGLVAGILLGGSSPEVSRAVVMGSMAGAKSFELKYSRENEEEADQLGFRYLCAAGYPPDDMANIMQKMAQGNWSTSSKIPSYLSTHPALGERVQYLRDLASQQRKKTGSKVSSSGNQGDFPIMQAALIAEYGDPRVALDRFEGDAQKGKTVALYGLGRFYLRQGKVKEAIPLLQQAARQDSASPFILSTLGSAYIEEGRLMEARRVLETALLLEPSASIVHFRLAMVLQEMGQKDAALEHLQQIKDLSPMFPEIDYNLGVLYGQLNRLGLAHYHLGRYYQQKQDWELAFFHYEKARVLLKESPDKLQELDKTLKEVEKKKKKAHWESYRK